MEPGWTQRLVKRLLSPRVWRFALVGLSGVPVNLGSLYLLADVLNLKDELGSAAAVEISILWNFVLNNAWTFRDKNENARVGFLSRLLRYNLVSLVGLAVQLLSFIVLTRLAMRSFGLSDPGPWKYPAQLAGIGLAMGWNFLSNFFWTWAQGESQPEAEDALPAEPTGDGPEVRP